MRVRYGGYLHPENEVNLAAFMVRPIYSQRNKRLTVQYQAHLQGEFCVPEDATTTALAQAAIAAKIDALVNAYGQNYGDFILYDNQGAPTRHSLPNDSSITGVRVMHRSWPRGAADEWATGRTWHVILEAEYVDADAQIVAWQETVRFIGTGGPLFAVVPTMRGFRRFAVTAGSPVTIVQEGQAIGLQGWVEPPGPLLPDDENVLLRDITLGAPQAQGQGYLNYSSQWRYVHNRVAPAVVIPNIR